MSGEIINERNHFTSDNKSSNNIRVDIHLDDDSDDISNIRKLKNSKKKKRVSSSTRRAREDRRTLRQEKGNREKVSKYEVEALNKNTLLKKIKDLGYETDNEDKKYKIREFDRLLGFDEKIPELNTSLRKLFRFEKGRARRSFGEDKARYKYKMNEIKKCIDFINEEINANIPVPYPREFHDIKMEDAHDKVLDNKSLLNDSVSIEHEGTWNVLENKKHNKLADGVKKGRVLNKVYISNQIGICAANTAAQYLYRYIPKFKEEYPLHVADDSDMWLKNSARMMTENARIIIQFINDMCPGGGMVYRPGYYITQYLRNKGYSKRQIHKHMSSAMFNSTELYDKVNVGGHAIYRINDNYVMNDDDITKLPRKNINYLIDHLCMHIIANINDESKLKKFLTLMTENQSHDSLIGAIVSYFMDIGKQVQSQTNLK